MPYRITFPLGPMNLSEGTPGVRDLQEKVARRCLRNLVEINSDILAAAKPGEIPPLMDLLQLGKVRLEAHKPGQEEDWQDILTSIKDGKASFEALECWRAAEAKRDGGHYEPRLGPWRKIHRLTFPLGVFDIHREVPGAKELREKQLYRCLSCLTDIDRYILLCAQDGEIPDLYDLHRRGLCRYVAEPDGQEDWQDILTTIRLGNGDCEDLACWRAAELQVKGIPAYAIFVWRALPDNQGTLYHIQVKLPGGMIEDPSKRLGMA